VQALDKIITEVFDELECQRELSSDLNTARGRILVACPFATVQGVSRWRTHFENAVKRGISLCVIIQEPVGWNQRRDGSLAADTSARLKLLAAAIELLQHIGAHVTLRPKMHEKVIVIDDCIMWEGSLNFLSWFNTTERARRWESRGEVAAAIKKHQLLPCDHCAIPSIRHLIAERRKALGLKLEDVARIAGTHRRLISEVESGIRDARLETIDRICNALGLQVLVAPEHVAATARRFIESRSMTK
jgi:hypothetical protein